MRQDLALDQICPQYFLRRLPYDLKYTCINLEPSTYQKTIQLEDCLIVRLEMIDTLGSGLPLHNYHSCFRDIDAVLLVYDVTRYKSVNAANKASLS